MSLVSPELLAILVCPVATCHGELEDSGDRLLCRRCGLQYLVDGRCPVLIPEEAEPTQES